MATTTRRDVIDAAMALAGDAAQGRCDPADLQQQVIAECKALFSTVVGADDPLFAVQLQVARAVLACHGIPAGELREWLRCNSVSRPAQGNDTA